MLVLSEFVLIQTVLFDCIDVYHPSQQCCSYAVRELPLSGGVLLGVKCALLKDTASVQEGSNLSIRRPTP